jgi:diadenylate cyclase
VGLSQETDAIVLIVSEETGDISIAERGRLIRKLTTDGLRGLLGELLGRMEGETFPRAA